MRFPIFQIAPLLVSVPSHAVEERIAELRAALRRTCRQPADAMHGLRPGGRRRNCRKRASEQELSPALPFDSPVSMRECAAPKRRSKLAIGHELDDSPGAIRTLNRQIGGLQSNSPEKSTANRDC